MRYRTLSMILLLLGTLGSGKSTIGSLVAADLRAIFIEMDHAISVAMGGVTPSDVRPSQWKECQIEISKDLSTQKNLVIAASGNIIENDINILYFLESGTPTQIIYLDTSIATLISRVAGGNAERQLLKKHLEELHAKRDALYRKTANFIVQTDEKTPRQIADEILSFVRSPTTR